MSALEKNAAALDAFMSGDLSLPTIATLSRTSNPKKRRRSDQQPTTYRKSSNGWRAVRS